MDGRGDLSFRSFLSFVLQFDKWRDYAISRRSRAMKAKKWTKLCAAREKLFFCYWAHSFAFLNTFNKILLLQKKVLHFIFFANRNVHAIPRFIVANILPISFLYFKSVSYLMHYIHTNTAPSKIVNCSRRHHLFMHITQDHPLKMICTSKNLIL